VTVTPDPACRHCGRPLPEPAERGRKQQYCNATCRSAARRARARRDADVNASLTVPSRKGHIDGGTLLDELTGVAGRLAVQMSGDAPLRAVASAAGLGRLVDQLMRMAVDRARDGGSTWQEIGDVLGTTRQAAFQRFGRPLDPRTGVVMAEAMLPGAADRAVELLGDIVDGRYRHARRDFDDTVAERLDESRLAAVWAHVVGMVGGYERMGDPHAYQAGDYTIVDVPMHFEAGDLTGRISYDRAGKVAGLHFVPATGGGGS
jgi:hypothetical protein